MKTTSIILALSLSVLALGCGSSSGSDVAATSAGDLSVSLSKTGTIYTGDSLNVTAVGGTSPYTYAVTEGDGTLDSSTGAFVAGSSKGYVTVQATDAASEAVQLRFYVYKSTSSSSSGGSTKSGSSIVISPADPEIEASSSVSFSATGGKAPYTYSIASGGGSISGAKYTGSGTAESVTIVATDANGDTSSTTVTLKVYSKINTTSYLTVDHQVGISLWNPSGATSPSLLIFGTGMKVTQLGNNVTCGYNATTGNLSSPCAVSVSLANIDNASAVNYAYRGTIKMVGRNYKATADFCIAPSTPNRVYLVWKSWNSLSAMNVTYPTYGARIASGKKITAHFNTVDTDTGAGSVTVTLSDAGYRAGESACPSNFTSSSYAEIAQ